MCIFSYGLLFDVNLKGLDLQGFSFFLKQFHYLEGGMLGREQTVVTDGPMTIDDPKLCQSQA